MARKRDPSTIDMFTGQVDPPVIPKNKALVARAREAPEQLVASVPSVPLSPKPTPMVPKPEEPKPAVVQPHQPDIPLFHYAYLLVLAAAWICISIVIADNLYDANIVASLIKARAHVAVRFDQYLMATIRGVASYLIAFITFLVGWHIAVRPTTLAIGRYAMAALFIATAAALAIIAYICERDYMAEGMSDIMRKLGNIMRMQW